MVRRCVAAGCSNTPTSLLTYSNTRRILFSSSETGEASQSTPAQWEATEHSVLCGKQFTGDCFEVNAALAQRFGMSKRRRLKEGAMPAVFERRSAERASTSSKRPCDPDTPTAPPERPCCAVEKLDRVKGK